MSSLFSGTIATSTLITVGYISVMTLGFIFIIVYSSCKINSKRKKERGPGENEEVRGCCNADSCGEFTADSAARAYLYSAFLVHVYDTGFDFGVMSAWFISDDPEIRLLAYVALCFIGVYKIISSISMLREGHGLGAAFLQFLDIQLFVDVYRSHFGDHGKVKITSTLYWIRTMEAILESCPQALLQFVFLVLSVERGGSATPLVFGSMLGSLSSITFAMVHFDDILFPPNAMNSSIVYIARTVFRASEIVARVSVLAFLWVVTAPIVVGLLLASEFLFFTLMTQLQVAPWEIFALILTNANLNLTFEGMHGSNVKHVRKNFLYRWIFKPVILMFTKLPSSGEALLNPSSPRAPSEYSFGTSMVDNNGDAVLFVANAHYVWRFLESVFLWMVIFSACFLQPSAYELVFVKCWFIVVISACTVVATPILYFVVRHYAKDSTTQERNLIALVIEGENIVEVKRLIKSGGNLQQKDSHGDTIVHAIVMNQKLATMAPELLGLCAQWGGKMNKRNHKGFTPFMQAVKLNRVDCMQALIEAGVSIHDQQHNTSKTEEALGESCVHLAAKDDSRIDALRYLALNGADMHAVYTGGVSPLHIASIRNAPDCLQFLGHGRGNLRSSTADGDNCWVLAAQMGNVKCLQVLKGFGINLNIPGRNGETAVFRACLHNHPSTLRWLLEYGEASPSVSMPDQMRHWTPLRAAYEKHNWGCVRVLDEFNVDIRIGDALEWVDEDGLTIAMWCCKHNEHVFFQHLARYGVNLKALDRHDMSCAHHAALHGSSKCIELLDDYNISLTGQDDRGDTPSAIAKRVGNKAVFEVLREYGAV